MSKLSIIVCVFNEIETNFLNASKNIPNVDVLPSQGLNVYNIFRIFFIWYSRKLFSIVLGFYFLLGGGGAPSPRPF